MSEQKKYLDLEGVKVLWNQVNLNDYPNNETLIAILDAIDQTKADKDELFSGSWDGLENKPFDEPCFYPVDILSADNSGYYKTEGLKLVLDRFNLYKTYKVVINGDEFILSNPTFHDANPPYIPTYRWGATDDNFKDFPFCLIVSKEDFDIESGDLQFSRYNNYVGFYWPQGTYPNLAADFHTKVQFYEEGLSKLDPKYLPEKYVTQEIFDVHTHSWESLKNKPFGETVIGNRIELSDFSEVEQTFDPNSKHITWMMNELNLYKKYVVKIREDEFIVSNPAYYDDGYYEHYIWGDSDYRDKTYEKFPFMLYTEMYGYDENGDYHDYYVDFIWKDEAYPNLDPQTEVQIYGEGLSKLDPKYLPENYATQEALDSHTHSWDSLENKPFGENIKVMSPLTFVPDEEVLIFGDRLVTDLFIEGWNLHKAYKIVIREDEFIIRDYTLEISDYDFYIWGDFYYVNDLPFGFSAFADDLHFDEDGNLLPSQFEENVPPKLMFSWNSTVYPDLDLATEVQIYVEGDEVSKIDPKYLPEDYVTQENFDTHTHSWNELEDKPFYSVINSDWHGDTIIENITETVDENGYKLAYADKYGFEMRLPFNIGDYLVYTVSGYVYDEEEEEVSNTSLYSSIGPAYYDGYEVFSDRVRADFNVDGRIVSVVVYNGTGYATFIELNGFEPDSEVSFGLHYATVEYHKIDSNYLSDDIARTAYVDDQLLNKIDISTLSDYYTKTEVEQFHDEIKDYVDNEVSALVNSAPETLDTLGELAEAFQKNKEVVDVLNEAIATKYSSTNPPPYPVTSVQGKTGDVNFTTETWTFTLTDGSTVTKKVLLG